MTEMEREVDDLREEEIHEHEREPVDPHGTGSFIKRSPYFVVTIIAVLLAFYIVAMYFAFRAY
jgi:hypothetical protein